MGSQPRGVRVGLGVAQGVGRAQKRHLTHPRRSGRTFWRRCVSRALKEELSGHLGRRAFMTGKRPGVRAKVAHWRNRMRSSQAGSEWEMGTGRGPDLLSVCPQS